MDKRREEGSSKQIVAARIIERTRKRKYNLDLNLGDADWMQVEWMSSKVSGGREECLLQQSRSSG